ncbi:hypothetical protein HDU97_005847 [Phlyctochytrium planicorne]|nr:hypothetical protein HDU97_005847 [Phlyctochytrium planicorne]
MSTNTSCVLEFKTCGKVNDHEALAMLKRVASLVKPLMKKRSWTLPILREFYPQNPNLLGLNVNAGREIKIRLRFAQDETRFFDFEDVLGTMLHELTHNVHGPHDAKFYKYLDDLTLELQDLRNKGWCGEGFDAPGLRVGMGVSHNVPEHQRRSAAIAAAEARAKVNKIMLPAGGKKLGGGNGGERRMAPGVMAALAAERRLRDSVWCGSEGGVGEDAGKGAGSDSGASARAGRPPKKEKVQDVEPKGWSCDACTFVNDGGIKNCELCGTPAGHGGSNGVRSKSVSTSSEGSGVKFINNINNDIKIETINAKATMDVHGLRMDAQRFHHHVMRSLLHGKTRRNQGVEMSKLYPFESPGSQAMRCM